MDRFGNEVSCGGALWQPGGLIRAEFVSALWRSLPELPGRLAMSAVLSIRCGSGGEVFLRPLGSRLEAPLVGLASRLPRFVRLLSLPTGVGLPGGCRPLSEAGNAAFTGRTVFFPRRFGTKPTDASGWDF